MQSLQSVLLSGQCSEVVRAVCVTGLLCVVQDGSYQAQSNLKFLSVLKEPCLVLADTHPRDIPPILPKILNLIRMIWVNSEFYNTKERLTGILRKVLF